MDHSERLRWLRTPDAAQLVELQREADRVRAACVGDAVHLRGLIEISNHCRRLCRYCGLRAANRSLHRYRMDVPAILACVRAAARFRFGTVVLQAGEDLGLDAGWVADLIRVIKSETPLAVTLSLGERGIDELAQWRTAGADRYLLRFETSNRALYADVHPAEDGVPDRLALLQTLRELGYELGSGVMVGLPGQTYDDLARDIELFRELDLDMIGVGPYIPHPDTPLGAAPVAAGPDQVPNSVEMTCKVLALARIACPWANIPATTAVATLDPRQGYERALRWGANVIMPNLTPADLRPNYAVYPGKPQAPDAMTYLTLLKARITDAGRTVGQGRGDSLNYLMHRSDAAGRVAERSSA